MRKKELRRRRLIRLAALAAAALYLAFLGVLLASSVSPRTTTTTDVALAADEVSSVRAEAELLAEQAAAGHDYRPFTSVAAGFLRRDVEAVQKQLSPSKVDSAARSRALRVLAVARPLQALLRRMSTNPSQAERFERPFERLKPRVESL